MPNTFLDFYTNDDPVMSCYIDSIHYLTTGMTDQDKYQCYLPKPIDQQVLDFIILITYVSALMGGVCYLMYHGIMITNYPEEITPSNSDDSEPDSISDETGGNT